MRGKLFFTFLGILTGVVCFAQTGSIRGFVYDDSNGEPVIFTNVYLKGTSYGASTDVNGYYAITKVPPGNYILAPGRAPNISIQNILVGKFWRLKKS